MKRTIRENVVRLPYCLHDARVNKIKIKLLDEDCAHVKFCFNEGYDIKDEDNSWVQGNILFKQVDLLFSRIYIMKVKGRRHRRIKGREYSISQFCKKFKDVDMEIVDETYGFNKTRLTGYMYNKNHMKEFVIELSHEGDMIYITEHTRKTI